MTAVLSGTTVVVLGDVSGAAVVRSGFLDMCVLGYALVSNSVVISISIAAVVTSTNTALYVMLKPVHSILMSVLK